MEEDGLIKKLMTSVKCSVCGHYYVGDNISIIGHRENLWFLKSHCSSCNSQCLVVAEIKEERVSRVITDLADGELKKLKYMGMPTGDDVLDMHNFLKEFNGDFSRLFEKQQG